MRLFPLTRWRRSDKDCHGGEEEDDDFDDKEPQQDEEDGPESASQVHTEDVLTTVHVSKLQARVNFTARSQIHALPAFYEVLVQLKTFPCAARDACNTRTSPQERIHSRLRQRLRRNRPRVISAWTMDGCYRALAPRPFEFTLRDNFAHTFPLKSSWVSRACVP